jgi:hypothetical protein
VQWLTSYCSFCPNKNRRFPLLCHVTVTDHDVTVIDCDVTGPDCDVTGSCQQDNFTYPFWSFLWFWGNKSMSRMSKRSINELRESFFRVDLASIHVSIPELTGAVTDHIQRSIDAFLF